MWDEDDWGDEHDWTDGDAWLNVEPDGCSLNDSLFLELKCGVIWPMHSNLNLKSFDSECLRFFPIETFLAGFFSNLDILTQKLFPLSSF